MNFNQRKRKKKYNGKNKQRDGRIVKDSRKAQQIISNEPAPGFRPHYTLYPLM